jgi:hypothetical protein
MRIVRVFCLVALVVFALLCIPISARQSRVPATKSVPKLQTVIVYQWALGSGITEVDFQSKRLESFVRGVRMSEKEAEAIRRQVRSGYPIFRIQAALANQDISALRRFIDGSGLYDFQPLATDIKQRKAGMDECPPTVVIVWADKTRVFRLPLHATVRKDIPKNRQQAYAKMGEICDSLWRLNDQYSRKPYVSGVSVSGKEYQAFEKERDHFTK